MSSSSKLEYKKGFSDIEKGIANYIIDHKEEVANMRLVELAEATLLQQRRSVVFARNWVKKTTIALRSILLHQF